MSNEAEDTINLVYEKSVGPHAYLHILWVVESPVGLRCQQSLFLTVLLLCDKTYIVRYYNIKEIEGGGLINMRIWWSLNMTLCANLCQCILHHQINNF